MTVALELGKTLEEMRSMPLDDLHTWFAYFELREEEIKSKRDV